MFIYFNYQINNLKKNNLENFDQTISNDTITAIQNLGNLSKTILDSNFDFNVDTWYFSWDSPNSVGGANVSRTGTNVTITPLCYWTITTINQIRTNISSFVNTNDANLINLKKGIYTPKGNIWIPVYYKVRVVWDLISTIYTAYIKMNSNGTLYMLYYKNGTSINSNLSLGGPLSGNDIGYQAIINNVANNSIMLNLSPTFDINNSFTYSTI
jgi:hypothetical protein